MLIYNSYLFYDNKNTYEHLYENLFWKCQFLGVFAAKLSKKKFGDRF